MLTYPQSYGICIFTAIAGLIVGVYMIVANFVSGVYNMWAILGLEIFMVVFWLSSMASLAAFRSRFVYPVYTYDVIFKKRDADYIAGRGYLGIMVGDVVFCAFEL
jgi:hypothetical protein